MINMNIFKFDDYRDYVLARIEAAPQSGRGQFRAIAIHLKMHPTLVSRVFNSARTKDLTFEQAADLTKFLKLSDLEADYFMALVEESRAGSKNLRDYVQKRKQKLRRQASEISAHFTDVHELNDAERATYYSHWYYSAIHLLADIPAYQSAESIAALLQLPLATIQHAIEFLVSTRILLRDGTKLSCGPTWIFEPPHSPHTTRHHINWRLRAIERLHNHAREEKFLTLPVTISKHDRQTLQQLIFDFVTTVKKTVEPSKPEQLSVLTIDLFDISH